jgi:zinc protease
VLSGGFYASQLYHDLRETHGYVYSVGTELAAGKTRSTFVLDFGASPQNVERAQTLALADIRAMGTNLLGEERLRRAKALLLGEVPIREQSYDGVTQTLLGYASEGLPLDQNLIDARAELDATPEAVRAAFAKWIRPAGFARVIVGPAPK